MLKIISIHEYNLKANADEMAFEKAIRAAEKRGLFELPGLVDYHFVKGVKGARKGRYAAIWIYESKEAWEELWGTPEEPKGKRDYPEIWRTWEDDVLAPFLDREADRIVYTAYETFA